MLDAIQIVAGGAAFILTNCGQPVFEVSNLVGVQKIFIGQTKAAATRRLPTPLVDLAPRNLRPAATRQKIKFREKRKNLDQA